jgi:uncharacterized membrane protein YbhN (UPF0104 family)
MTKLSDYSPIRSVISLCRILLGKRYRPWLVSAIISSTIAFFAHFFVSNPQYLGQLRHVPPEAIVLVVLLNIPAMAALAVAYDAMLRLCGTRIPAKENALLTAYSSIANFFGPFQSGPGVRAVYLKARYHVRVRDYLLATLIYYGFFASFSALFLLIGVRPWWQTLLALCAAATVSALVIGWFVRRGKNKEGGAFRLRAAPLITLAVATLLQLTFIAAYFFVELRAVNPHIGVGQAVSYSGAANFSLFVSLTPDAVGFREAFLVFSQQLHHVSTADILRANIIDRGAYLIFLVLLFIVVMLVHARDRLHIKGWRRVE